MYFMNAIQANSSEAILLKEREKSASKQKDAQLSNPMIRTGQKS
jgi:hypothetical protein